MTSLYVFAALACLLVDHAIAVVELTDNTFYDYAKDKDVLLVDFYAPWCPDCKNLDPDFESAAQSLGTRSLDLAKVDCFGAGKGLCATYGIKRWPTLKNFNRGTFTGDYNGGLTSSEIAGYITTVENSVTPNSNPYAMVVPQPIQQACISRCKIAKVPNNHNCFTKCKDKPFSTHNGAKKLMNMKMIAPKPVINEKSCAKCRIPQPAGRSHHCSHSARRACILKHRRHISADASAKRHSTKQKTNTDNYKIVVKKAAIQTLTSAANDNVVKLSLKEPLIVPPNAENKKQSVSAFTGKSKSQSDSTKGSMSIFESELNSGSSDSGLKSVDEGVKISDLSTRETLKLINDAEDKKTPVLDIPSLNEKLNTENARVVTINVPPHDSGDKKMGLQRATSSKNDKQTKPKISIKALKATEKHAPIKMQPKFTSLKVPPHDSGDKKADLQSKVEEKLTYPLPNIPIRQNLFNKNVKSKTEKASKSPQSKSAVEASPNFQNHFGTLTPGKKVVALQAPQKGAIKQMPTNDKLTISNELSKKAIHKNIDSMSPKDALKVPYDANDKKRTID